MPLGIEDYALIGDCETAALVGRDGSIDWLCPHAFDRSACFAALLGDESHGRWLLAPDCEIRATNRRYRENTLILETTFTTDGGEVVIIDCMPLRPQASDVVRIVECRRGTVPMKMELVIRFDYGSVVPWVRRRDDGLWAIAGPDALHLTTDVEFRSEDFKTFASFTMNTGDSIPFVLTWYPSHKPEPAPREPYAGLLETERWWREWSGRCTYQGRWQDEVRRSLITLKGLTYAPTGGVVAAVTTSLPERIGGERNWDYRFCWLRDSTFTLYALVEGGYLDEARAWREWLLRAVAGHPSELQIMYGLRGERRLTELELPWLPGYEQSRPVRVGNLASQQHQLDVYGEVMDTLHLARRAGLEPSDDIWRVQGSIMSFLASDWEQPDDGIWEVRGPRQQFTHSKVMAWVAADRAVKSAEQFELNGPVDEWRALRDRIHAQVCELGFNQELKSFTQAYGSRELDASLLMLPLVGFLPADDPRMQGTIAAVQQHLMRDGFVQRYSEHSGIDGLPPGEGTFLLCTFWLADNLALLGRDREAVEIFERLLALRNDVGLLAEQYDPHERRLLGNFPQAFSHVGLINTARNLSHHGGPAEERQNGHAQPS